MPYVNKSDLDNYGCLMLTSNIDLKPFQDLIDDNDVSNDGEYTGKVDLPHITLLYGLTRDYDPSLLKDLIDQRYWINCLEDIDIFENEKYDVLVFKVEKKDDLLEANERLKTFLEYHTNYPDYSPHMTIAYVKSGLGESYRSKILEKFSNELPLSSTTTNIIYSNLSGEEVNLY